MLGKLLDGRYQVIRVLGSGGFGQTYVAQDTRRPGNPLCVVKHLKPASSDPNVLETARRLFNSEAVTLEQLGNHDQIPRLLAYFEQEQEFYLVEELIEGHTLKEELIPGHRWMESQVIQMLQDVLGILEFVHSRGVIHRDIKPDNLIRRTSDNKIVLVDFGAVKQVQTQMVGYPVQVSATVAIGTPGYMPSEQARGLPRPNSDIYSLGIIAIQALTGLMPLQLQEDPNTGEILWQHLASVSPGLANVVSKMVQYHFKDRYQSATESLQALQQLNNFSPMPSYTPPRYSPPVYTPPPSQPPSPSQHYTIPAAPANPYRKPVTFAPVPVDNTTSPDRLPLIVGVFITVAVGAVGAAIAIHQQSPNLAGNPYNKLASSQSTCLVVIGSLNVRSGPNKNSDRVNSIPQGTSISITGNQQNGWVEINSPIRGWVYNDSQYIDCPLANRTPTATPTATPTQKESPKPTDSGSTDPVDKIVAKAHDKYQSGDFRGAIELLKSISSNTVAGYSQVQKTIAQWQQEWTTAKKKFDDVEKALNEGRWKDVLSLSKDPEFPDIQYWKDKLNKLVVEAEKRNKAETPNPTTTGSPTTSPSTTQSPTPQPSATSTPTPNPSVTKTPRWKQLFPFFKRKVVSSK